MLSTPIQISVTHSLTHADDGEQKSGRFAADGAKLVSDDDDGRTTGERRGIGGKIA